tara:strand:- start:35 stop:217 length:183 start_codon:yes stop_codon:yes gene_type:complete
MKKSRYLPFILTKILSITLKTLVLLIALNIILTTMFVLIKEQLQDNSQREASYLYFKDIR